MIKQLAVAVGVVVLAGAYSEPANATVSNGQQIKQRTINITQSNRVRGPITTPVRLPVIRKVVPSPSGS
jgi:hypothetical protein